MRLTRDDSGFTLIELLIAVVVLGVIVLGFGNVLVVAFRNTDATEARLALSHDAQISASYFAQDFAATGRRDYSSAGSTGGTVAFLPSVQLNAAYNADGVTCGTAATPTALLRLLSDDWDYSGPSPAVRTDVVAYYLRGTELHRMKCVAGGQPSDAVLAHDVDTATPAVTCSSTCTALPVPQQMTLAFTVTMPKADPYPVTLTGQRRQS
ncbi:PulJ/GspJ family protein [Kutzneria chonburiensis]|uniref:Type II secretion system protein J n=1 Tax=Kutzneria chonburiensis TaxID=1483604 RepID=A0ABV6N861_9PSEU|nr:prepilin-type N-terminal cleavage/methylation domain-containing protein [Kutzneria chonburiensis]